MSKVIVSFSGGKDSTAMLLRLLELGEQIDEIIFADTGFEFPEIYEYIKKIEKHICRKITILKPEDMTFLKYRKSQKELIISLKLKGVVVKEPLYNPKWNEFSILTKFEQWFYGIVTRGSFVGKQRGFPLVAFPCWFTREAKIVPLHKAQNNADIVYIGIAYDELERISKTDGRLKYPLVDWKWTEQDCIDYLNKKNLFNPLYVNFNRLGCWFCQKQGEVSLFVLFKNYPQLWERMKWWDKESKRVSGHYIKGNYPLTYLEEDFKKGKIPNKLPKYQCWNGCESVKKAFKQKQCGLGEFIELEKKEMGDICQK